MAFHIRGRRFLHDNLVGSVEDLLNGSVGQTGSTAGDVTEDDISNVSIGSSQLVVVGQNQGSADQSSQRTTAQTVGECLAVSQDNTVEIAEVTLSDNHGGLVTGCTLHTDNFTHLSQLSFDLSGNSSGTTQDSELLGSAFQEFLLSFGQFLVHQQHGQAGSGSGQGVSEVGAGADQDLVALVDTGLGQDQQVGLEAVCAAQTLDVVALQLGFVQLGNSVLAAQDVDGAALGQVGLDVLDIVGIQELECAALAPGQQDGSVLDSCQVAACQCVSEGVADDVERNGDELIAIDYIDKASEYGYYGINFIDAPQRFGNKSFFNCSKLKKVDIVYFFILLTFLSTFKKRSFVPPERLK